MRWVDVQGGWEEHDLSAQSQRRLEVYDLKLNADATWHHGSIMAPLAPPCISPPTPHPERLDGSGGISERVGRFPQHMGLPAALDNGPVSLHG